MAKRVRLQRVGAAFNVFIPVSDDQFEMATRNLSEERIDNVSFCWRRYRSLDDALRAFRTDSSMSPIHARLRRAAGNAIIKALRNSAEMDFDAAEAELVRQLAILTEGLAPQQEPLSPTVDDYEVRAVPNGHSVAFLKDSFKRRLFEHERQRVIDTDEVNARRNVGWELEVVLRPAIRAFRNPVDFFLHEVTKWETDDSLARVERGDSELTVAGVALSLWKWGAALLLRDDVRNTVLRLPVKFQSRIFALIEFREAHLEGRPQGAKDDPTTSKRKRNRLEEFHTTEHSIAVVERKLRKRHPDAPEKKIRKQALTGVAAQQKIKPESLKRKRRRRREK